MLKKNNKVTVVGKISKGFTYSHQVRGEHFYMTEVIVERLSEKADRIPVLISERLIDVREDFTGEIVEINGEFRSYNKQDGERRRLILELMVREIEFCNGDLVLPVNSIGLDGFICKPPVYRKTPLGRGIADVLLAVNRPCAKSDYIPCICWGRNARWAGSLPVGTGISITGRIQSRNYSKDEEIRTAYEASIWKMEVTNENNRIETAQR